MKIMKAENNSKHFQYFLNLLITSMLTIMLTITAIIYNNSVRSSPLFLFLLALGVSILFARGLTRGGILGLLIISISIATKQLIGSWSKDQLFFNLLETFLMAMAFGFSGYYHDSLKAYYSEYIETKQKLKQLDLEDPSIGLIKPAIGALRLKEERDRAIRFKRPIALALILARPKPGHDWSPREELAIMRSIATVVKDTTRVLDIPFLVCSNKIALILPDTEINGSNKVINNIQRQLIVARSITQNGTSEPLQHHAQIRFGLGVFLGYSHKQFDMMEAAEKSLQRNIETNIGGIFQNLFIDWETLGELSTVKTILPPSTRGVLDTSERVIQVIENNQPS
jgi:hypothetical protein